MRKSSHAGSPAGVPGTEPPRRAAEYLGYEPTPGQRLVKSKFWQIWRDDPSLDAQLVDANYVSSRVDAPNIRKWWADDGFREWFLGREEFRARADAAVNMWLDLVIRRLSGVEYVPTKDLASIGKLLADVAGKISKSSASGDDAGREADKPKLTAEQQRELVGKAALSMGWTPPILLLKPRDAE